MFLNIVDVYVKASIVVLLLQTNVSQPGFREHPYGLREKSWDKEIKVLI
jgi:hypothetical protein